MKVYHGSVEIVDKPEIRIGKRTLDYGIGFYVTTSESQAIDWTLKRCIALKLTEGYVNVYSIDEKAIRQLKMLRFDGPTDEWIDFVHANRTDKSFSHDYDVVYGPVADDRVYTAFALFESGLLSREELKVRLKSYELVDQFLFHTEESLKYLHFETVKSIKV